MFEGVWYSSSRAYPGGRVAEGPVPHLPGGPPILQPYRDADANRLLITGIRPHLGPELFMPFVELEVLRSIPPNDLPFPDCSRDDPKAVREVLNFGIVSCFFMVAELKAPRDFD